MINSNRCIVGLIDVNNFYVSCERIFMPQLENKPVIVLSNNDGCVVARSNESKRLGIKMGEPFYKIKPIVQKHGVEVFSSNYSLYGDMSERVMSILTQLVPSIEIYSIDEAFIDLSGFNENDLLSYGHHIVKTIQDYVGLPVSVGIGSTKTLAKVANHVAKKWAKAKSVFNICDPSQQKTILPKIAIEDIWGIGYKTALKLKNMNVHTAWDFVQCDEDLIHHRFNISVVQTLLELKGSYHFNIDNTVPSRKQIRVSRTLSRRTKDLNILRSLLTYFVANAAVKLRSQGSVACALLVFIETNSYRPQDPQYQNSCAMPFKAATDSTFDLIHYALEGLSSIYRPHYDYHRLGVILIHLLDKAKQQLDIFEVDQLKKDEQLMDMLDTVNETMGTGTVRFAMELESAPWLVRGERCTPRYTTCWEELPIIKD